LGRGRNVVYGGAALVTHRHSCVWVAVHARGRYGLHLDPRQKEAKSASPSGDCPGQKKGTFGRSFRKRGQIRGSEIALSGVSAKVQPHELFSSAEDALKRRVT
jgi:hypothetical protein